MLVPRLSVPVGTPVIVVDPLKDFESGEFVTCYGLEDTEPVREVIARLRQMVEAWQGKARLVLCASLYDDDQFKVPGLEKLCTTDAGRQSVIPPGLFHRQILKRQNSFGPTMQDLRPIVENDNCLIITGLTTTSCVVQSVNDCRAVLGRVRLIVPANAVGTRKGRQNDGQRLVENWSQPNELHVTVVPRWEGITFEEEKPLTFDH